MHEMNNLDSLSIFVGTGQCNASCAHCAGKIHRKYAPSKDGIINEELIYNTLKECNEQGAKSLSLSSSGEPTLSPLAVAKTFDIIERCKKEGFEYSQINLYSNGIVIGENKLFCDTYLPQWKNQGLKTIYITIHNPDEKENAKVYGIKKYPPLKRIISRIHDKNLLVRANLVLGKKLIGTLEKFVSTIDCLEKMGVDTISAWPIRNEEDKLDYILSPAEEEMNKMEEWIENNKNSEIKIRLLRENSRIAYTNKKKLTLFPDGTLSNTWCNH